MFNQQKIYYKSLNLLLNIFVKSKSIPENPIEELGISFSYPIIYILSCNSKIDLLTLRTQCLCKNLPDPFEPIIIDCIQYTRYLFIDNSSNTFSIHTLKSQLLKLFYDYFNLNKNKFNLDVQIILVSIIFRRYPSQGTKQTNQLFLIINYIKKFFSIIWLGRDSLVRFSSPISLRKIVTKYGYDETVLYKLTRMARIYFSRQYLAIVGPRLLKRQELFNKLLSSRVIIKIIEDVARNKKISYEQAKKNAIFLMKEIAANFSYRIVRLTDYILGFVINCLYQKINVFNTERIRQLAYSNHEIVYVPCHRSHMDYLLLSYVIYHQGLILPHIVAGINLNFWPAGPIFRRLGAFFIRRKFKSNKLYSTIFREYLSILFRLGYPVEYFIEGGRSRTGRLLSPRTGILSMTIQAVLKKTNSIILIPIYIGYEHVIEVNTYIKELKGAIKKKESLSRIFRSLRKLHNLGHCYINFGEPLSIISYLNKYIPNWQKSFNSKEKMSLTYLVPVVNNIATDLMTRINNAGTVNAINLCCTVLLAAHQYSVTRDQLIKQLNCYLDLMRNVPYSSNSFVPSINADLMIDHALKMHTFKIKKNNIIIFPRKKAALMGYYRNNIMHMVILPSLIATVIVHYRYISYNELFYCIENLYPMLKAELFLRWNQKELLIEINKLIYELLRQKLIIEKSNKLKIDPSYSPYTLQLLAKGANETLQRYAIIFSLMSSNPSIEWSLLERKSQIIAKKFSIIYNIDTPEFFDKSIFNKLIMTLRVRDCINNSESEYAVKMYQIVSKLITSDVRLIIENISK